MTTARLYKPTKTALQSGKRKTHDWVLEFINPDGDALHLSKDPLMNWTSSFSTTHQLSLHFKHLEEALAYAEKEKIELIIEDSHPRVIKSKSYSDNFKYKIPSLYDI